MYKIILSKACNELQQSVVTIGNFDGLHRGHYQLIHKLNQVAEKSQLRRILVTFEPLPAEFFLDTQSKSRVSRLSLIRDKYLILKKADLVDELVILHFNQSLALMPPKQFIDQILVNRLNAVHVVIGHDFKFGSGGAGNESHFIASGIQVTVVGQYLVDGHRVSSSILRKLAKSNELTQLTTYLGRNIQYTSRVIYGNQLGRKFGVPTINLSLGRNRPALWGVYVGYAHIDGVTYNSVISIGQNPTLTNSEFFKLEAHLLDVDLDLYGKIATIEVLQYLREEKKFNDLDSLFAQIHQDLQDARNYFLLERESSGNLNNGL